jgi:hypothetical protein
MLKYETALIQSPKSFHIDVIYGKLGPDLLSRHSSYRDPGAPRCAYMPASAQHNQ